MDRWIVTEAPFATWVVGCVPILTDRAAVDRVVAAIFAAGAAHRVWELVEAPDLGPGDPLAAWRARGEDPPDLFGFTGAAMAPRAPGSSTARGWIHWTEGGELREGWVEDLGELVARLVPEDDLPRGWRFRAPPVRITGPRLARVPRRAPEIRLALHSDRWLPWIFGSTDPDADHRSYFSNRALADRDTPRLNAFLADVRQQAEAAGATFALDPEETGKDAARWCSAAGIDLSLDPAAEQRRPG
jgi:hypothetical protein